MRSVAMAIAVVATVLSTTAHAELTAVELESRGETLAKTGRYAEAIEAFKAADHIRPRASHACLIALAYARRELWFQSEIWLATCAERAKPDDPEPEWVPEVRQQIASHERDRGVVAVTIDVSPHVTGARVALADFPEAPFLPRTLHLPRGHHELVVETPGYTGRQRFELGAEATSNVVVELRGVRASPMDPRRKGLLIGGAALVAFGAVSYGVMGASYLSLRDSPAYNNSEPNRAESIYKVARITTISSWALGAGLVLAGLLWHPDRETPTLAATPLPGGGLVNLTWTR